MITVTIEEREASSIIPGSKVSVKMGGVGPMGPQGIQGAQGQKGDTGPYVDQFGIVASGNYSEFDDSTGFLTTHGDACAYADVYAPFASAKTPAANTPTWSAFTAHTGAYTFAVNDYMDMSTIEIPHTYEEGTDLEIHIHLANNGLDATQRLARYIAYYTIGRKNAAFSAEQSLDATLTIPANTADKTSLYLSLGTINGASLKIGDQIKFNVRRLSSAGPEPSGNPFLGMLGIHYRVNTLGSRSISTK